MVPQEVDADVDACGGDEQSRHIAHDNEERMDDEEERGDQRAHVAPACGTLAYGRLWHGLPVAPVITF